MQRDARDIGRDGGDFDMVVSLAGDLRALRNIGAAMLAGNRQHIAPGRRSGMQRTMRAGMGLALVLAGWLLRRLVGRLLCLARRRAGIVRRPRRQAEFCLKLGDTRHQDFDLPGQRRDHLRLGQIQADQRFIVERFKGFAIHQKLESVPARLVKKPPPGDSQDHQTPGREQLL